MRIRALGILVLLVGLSLFSYAPPISGNPYWVPDLSVGGIWNNCTNVQMPFADVHIQINYLGQATFHIEMVGNFTILTNETQDCVLAFAYPSSWDEGSAFSTELLFNITLDEIPLTTWSLEFENASWIYLWSSDKLYHMSCNPDYVGFNVSLQADVYHTLEVRSSFIRMTDFLDLGYVCGTALSFMGSTRERITMVVNQSTPLSRIVFYPSSNLTVTNESLYATAVWDLYYPDPIPWDGDYYPIDGIGVSLGTFETYTPPTPTTEPTQSTTTTVPPTTTVTPTTQPDVFGRIVLGGALGIVICAVPVVLWKARKT